MLPEETVERLALLRRTVQIIVFALIMGVVFFFGIVLVMHEGKWTFLGPDTQYVMLFLAAVLIVTSFTTSSFVPGGAVPTGTQHPSMRGFFTGDPVNDAAVRAAGKLQTRTIIGCAQLEGAAFVSLVGALISGDAVHLAVAGVCVAGIALRFPMPGAYLEQITRMVEEDDASFS